MARHSISKKEHWREGYGFDSFAKDADHEKWQKIASELMPHDWAQFALLGERLLPLKDEKKHSKNKPAWTEALGHLETAIEKWQRLCQHVKKISIELSKYINTKIYKGEQIEDLGTLEQQKAFVLERTQLPKLQEMMVLNARSSTDENIKNILKTTVVPFQELEKVHIQLGALFRNPCKRAKG